MKNIDSISVIPKTNGVLIGFEGEGQDEETIKECPNPFPALFKIVGFEHPLKTGTGCEVPVHSFAVTRESRGGGAGVFIFLSHGEDPYRWYVKRPWPEVRASVLKALGMEEEK